MIITSGALNAGVLYDLFPRVSRKMSVAHPLILMWFKRTQSGKSLEISVHADSNRFCHFALLHHINCVYRPPYVTHLSFNAYSWLLICLEED